MSEPLRDHNIYPVLPLRDIVVFPHMIVPLFVGRERSVRALEDIMKEDKKILLVSQKEASQDDPSKEDLYQVGTIATVLQLLKLPDGTVKVLVEGNSRARVVRFTENEDFFQVEAQELSDEKDQKDELEALLRSVMNQFESYLKLNKKVPPEVLISINQIEDNCKLADTIASHLTLKIHEKQSLLETISVCDRLECILTFIESEIGVLQVEKKIRNRVKLQMEKTQKEYYLNEQMKAIQKELGESDDRNDELAELEQKIDKVNLSKEAHEKACSELKKLRSMSSMSAEATVVRNYLDWLLNIPWSSRSRVSYDLNKAQSILDADHYALEEVKERVLEYLAVQSRTRKLKGPILCLVGPPGVGKTSLARSIARATGRKFVRISLGGVRDESEIRGHRRTYIGSMPGKIVQSLKKAKKSNPLFLLDEIDKMANDFRGDPASALLEVLDPEQNKAFNDHYLEVDYDLSDVMFITTANSLNMSRPLLDRMEVIRISGYTEEEKVEISKRHLVSKTLKANGLEKDELSITDDILRDIVRYYTREAGVRSLERELSKLARKITKKLVVNPDEKDVDVCVSNLFQYLGPRKFKYGKIEKDDLVGVVTGLAWTQVGGELLSIESVVLPGKSGIKTTGKLGEVMQESVQAARSYVYSRSKNFGINLDLFKESDIHIHLPEGATPKDGPSAGIAMVTSVVSLLTGIPVRSEVAMTGEVTLRGRVLEIGGLKEKLLAALRGGIKKVLIPFENKKDLDELPQVLKDNLEILPVQTVDEVLDHALSHPVTPLDWDDKDEKMSHQSSSKKSLKKSSDYLRH